MCVSGVTARHRLEGPPVPSVARNLDVLAGFLARVDVLGFALAAVEHARQIRADLASGGSAAGPHNVLIAGHARSRGLCLVTNSVSEFERVIGPRLVNWVN